jgi:cytochrome c
MSSPRNNILAAVVGAAAFLAFAGYAQYRHERASDVRARAEALTGGDSVRGERAFARRGCGGCHAVKGSPGAAGMVGPPLDGVALRAIIGGRLENKPENMIRWIAEPQSVSPGTAMPNLGIGPAESRDIAAFLYTRT